MRQGVTTVERAYQLARSGESETIEALADRLAIEGHDDVEEHLSAPSLRKELLGLCRANRSKKRCLLPRRGRT